MLLLALGVLMRFAHVLAGGVWVGGSVVYLLVIVPALRLGKASPELHGQMGDLFRRVVNLCIGVLVLSGVYLIFDRLSTTSVGVGYLIVLAVKVLAALAMFALAYLQAQEARRPARKRGQLWRVAPRLILGLGVATFLLGATLTGLFEVSLGLVH